MATMTHEAPASSPVHLGSSLQRELEAKIQTQAHKVTVIELAIREAGEKLSNARDVYNSACIRLAEGKTNVDVEAARAAMQKHESLIEGLKARLREPQSVLDGLRRELSAEVARVDEARQSIAVLDEREAVEEQIQKALRAIDERNQLDQSIMTAIQSLRSRTYLTSQNKQTAFEGAYKIDRKAAGMLN